MKTTRLVAMLAMAGASLFAGQSAAPQKATVNVCMETDPYILMGVRPLASAMFASIGVRIAWHELDSCPAEVGAIQVRLSRDSTRVRDSGGEALAFARPYAGTVVVFLSRSDRAGFMPGRGRRHPGAPVPRLDQGSRFGCRSPGLCTALCRDRRRVSRPRGRAESQRGAVRVGPCAGA